jgi:hypothetical protein
MMVVCCEKRYVVLNMSYSSMREYLMETVLLAIRNKQSTHFEIKSAPCVYDLDYKHTDISHYYLSNMHYNL